MSCLGTSRKSGYDGHLHSRYEVDQCKSGFIKFKNGCQKFVGCEEILKAEATASVKIGNGRVKDHTWLFINQFILLIKNRLFGFGCKSVKFKISNLRI